MKVVDPIVVAFNKLSPWTIALSGTVLISLVLAQRKRSSNSKICAKPRKIHSLGTKIPIIGDMLEMLQHADRRADWFAEQCQRFNYEPWQVKIPGTPTMIVLTDPAHVEAVTTSQVKNFVKSEMHRDINHDVLGRGLVNAEGEHWHHQRKTAAKFFSARTLRLMMTQTMQRNINLVSAELDAVAGTGEFANLTNLFQRFTMQTFLEVGVGIDAPIIGNKEPTKFDAIDEAMMIIMHRRLVPPVVWKLQRWLNIGREKRLKELMTDVYAFVQNLIDQTLSKGSESKSHDDENHVRTAIDLFVQHSHEDKVGLRPQDLLDFVLNFVLGARDTSSVATQWFFYALSKHPEVEAKIREELAAHLPTLGVGRDDYITDDHVKKLIYLEATIKETLRYHSPAPINMREAVEDTVIDGDLVIRKGQAVAMPLYALGRNPRVWGPDANEFRPERWIDEKTGELIVVPPTKFVTFSAGPRICIGLKLAMLNIRVLTANMLHRYKFEIDPSNDGSYVHSLVLAMRHDLLAKVERIEDSH